MMGAKASVSTERKVGCTKAAETQGVWKKLGIEKPEEVG
jgi:hypothetical protein